MIDPFRNQPGLGGSQRERVAESYMLRDPETRAKSIQNRQKEPGFQPDRLPWRDRFAQFFSRCARRFQRR
jgi:hypothetical protein